MIIIDLAAEASSASNGLEADHGSEPRAAYEPAQSR
jgi:hypothetical protein